MSPKTPGDTHAHEKKTGERRDVCMGSDYKHAPLSFRHHSLVLHFFYVCGWHSPSKKTKSVQQQQQQAVILSQKPRLSIPLALTSSLFLLSSAPLSPRFKIWSCPCIRRDRNQQPTTRIGPGCRLFMYSCTKDAGTCVMLFAENGGIYLFHDNHDNTRQTTPSQSKSAIVVSFTRFYSGRGALIGQKKLRGERERRERIISAITPASLSTMANYSANERQGSVGGKGRKSGGVFYLPRPPHPPSLHPPTPQPKNIITPPHQTRSPHPACGPLPEKRFAPDAARSLVLRNPLLPHPQTM